MERAFYTDDVYRIAYYGAGGNPSQPDGNLCDLELMDGTTYYGYSDYACRNPIKKGCGHLVTVLGDELLETELVCQ